MAISRHEDRAFQVEIALSQRGGHILERVQEKQASGCEPEAIEFDLQADETVTAIRRDLTWARTVFNDLEGRREQDLAPLDGEVNLAARDEAVADFNEEAVELLDFLAKALGWSE